MRPGNNSSTLSYTYSPKRVKLKILVSRIKNYYIGNDEAVNLLLVSLLTEGSLLILGPPGTGKTLLAKTFATAIGGTFKRIQMAPDLLPSDITGGPYYDLQESAWKVKLGPVFANVVMVDELNRASPRTQSAFIEVMQEKQVTIEGTTYPLPRPFLVIATMIPEESRGVYPIPMGEIDRFAYSTVIPDYDPDIESEVLRRLDSLETLEQKSVLTASDVMMLIDEVKKVYIHERVRKYIISLVEAVRKSEEVRFKPSTRAAIWLAKGARAIAYMNDRNYVLPDDVKALAIPVLRHRIVLKPEYELDGVSPELIVRRALDMVEVPKT